MIRSPLRYPGGKSRAAKRIAKLAPNFREFREPFVGGGSIFFELKHRFPEREFWINDIYHDLANFWQQMKVNPSEVIARIESWRKEFPDGKLLYRFLVGAKNDFDKTNLAAAFFVFNRVSFSGTTEAGGYSSQAFESRFTQSSIERLKEIPTVLSDVRITNCDYEELLNTEGDDVFLFLDPPYFSATPSALYGKNGKLHTRFDHRRFAENLSGCKHKWLLTYDDSPFIRELFSFAQIESWNLMYGMRNQTETSNQLGRELFISNFSIKFEVTDEISVA